MQQQQTVVVAIENLASANNLFQMGLTQTHLIKTTGGRVREVRVVIHYDPKMKVSGTELQTNFDVLLSNVSSFTTGEMDHFFLPPHRVHQSRRLNKRIQRILMNLAGNGFSLFLPINIWTKSFDNTPGDHNTCVFGAAYEGKVVLKTENQARGIGQVLFDTKDYSPGMVYYETRQCKSLEGFENRLPKASLGYDPKNSAVESINVFEKDNVFIEEFVEGIEEEFRVLFAGNHMLVFSRERVSVHNEYYQATGANAGMKDPIEIPIDEPRWVQIREFIKSLDTTYGSLDIFFTKDKWGAFEYCNQYGTDGVKSFYAEANNLAFINEIVTTFINGEIEQNEVLDRRRKQGDNGTGS